MKGNEPRNAAGKTFEMMAAFETINGVDIPMESMAWENIQAMTQAINDVSMVVSGDALQQISKVADDNIEAFSTNFIPPKRPRGLRRQNLHMWKMLGKSAETLPQQSDKERKRLSAVKAELLELNGFEISFRAVLEILVTRWNNNCYRHINDNQIASIVRLLLERDERRDVEECEQRVWSVLLEINRDTNKMDAHRNKGDWEVTDDGPSAPVISILTGEPFVPLKLHSYKNAELPIPDNDVCEHMASEPAQRSRAQEIAEIKRRLLQGAPLKETVARMANEGIPYVGMENQPEDFTRLSFIEVNQKLAALTTIDIYQVARLLFQWKNYKIFNPFQIKRITTLLRNGGADSVRLLLLKKIVD